MNKQEAFDRITNLKNNFLLLVSHKEGGVPTKAMLKNVDADIIERRFIVFKNRENNCIVIPVAVEPLSDGFSLPERKKKPDLPTESEIERDYMTEILEVLIRRDSYAAEEDKAFVLDCFAEWIEKSPSQPQNRRKLEAYESLKNELISLGLIVS